MHRWYYDKMELRNTPSAADKIDYETESRYRREGARFIIDTGTKMDLGCNTIATGVVYFHRFYMYHSFRNFPRYVTACCCLFLAGKVEETPKKCKDIIKAARGFLTDQKFSTFGDDPKEEVMTLERILLQTIKFDLQVEHPYHFLLKYAKCLKGDKTKLQKMVQMAWTFVNDSLCTTLCLQWEPEVIAVALMYLAGKLSKFDVLDWTGRQPKHLRWWDMFIEDITMDLLEDICHQVLDLYSQPHTSNHPDSPLPTLVNKTAESHTERPSNSAAQITPAIKVPIKMEDKTHLGNSEVSKLLPEHTKPPQIGVDPSFQYPSFPVVPSAPAVPPIFPQPFPPPPTTYPSAVIRQPFFPPTV